jgi:hypothetical protein
MQIYKYINKMMMKIFFLIIEYHAQKHELFYANKLFQALKYNLSKIILSHNDKSFYLKIQ